MRKNKTPLATSIDIWGITINPIKKEEFIEIIDQHISINSKKFLHITGVNPETIAHTYNDPQLLKAIQGSDLVNVDNTLILIMLRLSGISVPERVATPDLFESMLALAEKQNYSIYIIGAKEDVLIRAIARIKTLFPKIHIAGFRNGYFKQEETYEVCIQIKNAKPDMLFLALPSPEKEMFIYNNKSMLEVPVLLGVGGAVDVFAGLVKRAPLYLRKIGLEGLHRVIQNPFNYGKRYIQLYPIFIKIALKELLTRKIKK